MEVWLLAAVASALGCGFIVGWSFIHKKEFLKRRGRGPGAAASDGLFGAVRRKRRQREASAAIERHVPEMMDAVALGMKAGLSFDSAFGLYHARFDDELARACAQAHTEWESGLVSREQALTDMAERFDSAPLRRFASNVSRNLKFGSSIVRVLGALSAEAQAAYRTRMEEKVAKVPVRMLMPTAMLILPAMLIVVLGPVMLELL